MKKFLLVSSILFCILFFVNAQTVILLQHGNISTAIYNGRLDSAILIAQTGDIIYLSGGIFTVGDAANNLHITKKLSIIGAGYNTDSTSATTQTSILGNIYFDYSSSGSTLTGTSISGGVNIIDTAVSNVTIANNFIYGMTTIGAGDWMLAGYYCGSNVLISENILGAMKTLTKENFTVLKNIFLGGLTTYTYTSAFFTNNIFLASTANGQPNLIGTSNRSGCGFYNNLIYSGNNEYALMKGAVNNLVVYNTLGVKSIINIGAYGNNDLIDTTVNLSNLFVKYFQGNWQPSWNLHLALNSIGHNAGNDGTDVGIYGTSTPYKDGGIPFNPHIQSASIINSPDGSGNLRVNIKVAAQRN